MFRNLVRPAPVTRELLRSIGTLDVIWSPDINQGSGFVVFYLDLPSVLFLILIMSFLYGF